MYIDIIKKLISRKLSIATAESITGGLISKLITDVPGSSEIFEEGFITYSNEIKKTILGVDPSLIDTYGVVSKEVAKDMAVKLKSLTGKDICISSTGNAGPNVCDNKPVGRVYIGINYLDDIKVYECDFSGDRNEVREKTAIKVFEEIDKLIIIWLFYREFYLSFWL